MGECTLGTDPRKQAPVLMVDCLHVASQIEKLSLYSKPIVENNRPTNSMVKPTKQAETAAVNYCASSEKVYLSTRGECTMPEKNLSTVQRVLTHKVLLVMVGLPVQGKSFLSQKIAGYLNWIGYNSHVFDLSEYRRSKLGSFYSHDWFRADNIKAELARTKMKQELLDQIFTWFKNDGHVAILDGNNCSEASRGVILKYLKSQKHTLNIEPIFIEVANGNPSTLQVNTNTMIQTSPDYVEIDADKAMTDLLEKISHLAEGYQPLVGSTQRYITCHGDRVISNYVSGYLQSKVLCFLSNMNLSPPANLNPIYLVRHGQSEYNVTGQIGGNPGLTKKGTEFARKLAEFVQILLPQADRQLSVWTSTLERSIQTAQGVSCLQRVQWKSLEEIHTGVCDGMTYDEVKQQMPAEYEARSRDKLRYRYPNGESYEDLILRLEPVIVELERRSTPVLIVGHQAVLRCLYAYFSQQPRTQVPHIEFPSCCVIRVQPEPYRTLEERFLLSTVCKN